MKLIFEKSVEGRRTSVVDQDAKSIEISEKFLRKTSARIPELSELDIARHYRMLAKEVHGVNDGFYPLGSCTMKYNPAIHEDIASMETVMQIHPLQPIDSVQGSLKILHEAEKYVAEITGMDAVTFQPAAGAQGELTGILMIKAYHESRNDKKRDKIIVPDAAHGTNPATAAMTGYKIINIPSTEDGRVDIEVLKQKVGDDTAALMLTNPNTLGIFDENILEITKIVHDAGGLNYYDGANLNAIMGIVKPGAMGFDVIHLNLHKTMSTPHGGGGPGSGAVGAKNILKPFFPKDHPVLEGGKYSFEKPENSIGRVTGFYGNFAVSLRAYLYMAFNGKNLKEVSQLAVLNANYLKHLLEPYIDISMEGICMHEFVVSAQNLRLQTGVSAMDISKSMLDYGIHPPTMYFPLIVSEALMFEPTETESKETLDEAAKIIIEILEKAKTDPEYLKSAPHTTVIGRPDEVGAARKPVLKYSF